MDTAYDLYTSQGIVKTTIEDISKKAGIAKGTFYLYFKDKYDLQDKLIASKTERIFEHALEHSGYQDRPSTEDKVLAIVDDILGQLTKEKLTLKFIYKNLSWGVFRHAIDRSGTDYAAMLSDIVGSSIDEKDIDMVIYTILELVGSTCYSVILYDDPVDMETYRPHLHKAICAILRSYENREL